MCELCAMLGINQDAEPEPEPEPENEITPEAVEALFRQYLQDPNRERDMVIFPPMGSTKPLFVRGKIVGDPPKLIITNVYG